MNLSKETVHWYAARDGFFVYTGSHPVYNWRLPDEVYEDEIFLCTAQEIIDNCELVKWEGGAETYTVPVEISVKVVFNEEVKC